jgi:hypothetical protein
MTNYTVKPLRGFIDVHFSRQGVHLALRLLHLARSFGLRHSFFFACPAAGKTTFKLVMFCYFFGISKEIDMNSWALLRARSTRLRELPSIVSFANQRSCFVSDSVVTRWLDVLIYSWCCERVCHLVGLRRSACVCW